MKMEKRAEFYARSIAVMNCTPGNCDHAKGEPASIISIGHLKNGEITQWVISLRDSRLLVAKLLVVLATYEDKFARHLLDRDFPADEQGEFKWPDDPETFVDP